MIGVDIIKQSLENNSNKTINTDTLKKLAKIKISNRFSDCFTNYQTSDILERIVRSELSEEKQSELLKFYKNELTKCYEDSKSTLEELFGKKITSEKEDDGEEDHSQEDNSNENKSYEKTMDNLEKKETPAENVVNNNDENKGSVIFNY